MINIHFPSISLKDSVAVLLMYDPGISLIAGTGIMTLGTIADPKVCHYCKIQVNQSQCLKNSISFEFVTSSRFNSSNHPTSACQWWLFIHDESFAESTPWSPGQQPWQLSPQSTGSSFGLLWAWPCPAVEENIAHQTKQFMARSNFDLGPPKMPLLSENENNLEMWGHKTAFGIVWEKMWIGTKQNLCSFIWSHGLLLNFMFINFFCCLNRFFPASELVLFQLLTQSQNQVLPAGSTAKPGRIPCLLQGCVLPCLHSAADMFLSQRFMAPVIYGWSSFGSRKIPKILSSGSRFFTLVCSTNSSRWPE